MSRIAYTKYAFFEWGLIIADIMFDSAFDMELKEVNVEVRTSNSSLKQVTKVHRRLILLKSRVMALQKHQQ